MCRFASRTCGGRISYFPGMKYFLCTFLLVSAFACSPAPAPVENETTPVNVAIPSLSNTMYYFYHNLDTANCQLGKSEGGDWNIIFLNDSEFYKVKSYRVETVYAKGKYKISGDTLTLRHDSLQVIRNFADVRFINGKDSLFPHAVTTKIGSNDDKEIVLTGRKCGNGIFYLEMYDPMMNTLSITTEGVKSDTLPSDYMAKRDLNTIMEKLN
jgi:hypothetical protein